jgi:hypothetical protein
MANSYIVRLRIISDKDTKPSLNFIGSNNSGYNLRNVLTSIRSLYLLNS